jgi:HAD superfamily hydrolase (TIGR01509 family)
MIYIFDFDGTLVDSMPTWSGVHVNALKSAGIPVPDDFVQTITPLGNYRASQYTISLGLDVSLESYLDFVSKTLYEAYTTRIELRSGVKEKLSELKAAGHSLNVLTASPHHYLDPCLRRHGIYDLFDKVWTIEDFGYTKAQTIIYTEAARRLDASIDRCVFVDDNATAVETAKKAGMYTVGIFDETSKDFAPQLKAVSDLYIEDFSQIPSL